MLGRNSEIASTTCVAIRSGRNDARFMNQTPRVSSSECQSPSVLPPMTAEPGSLERLDDLRRTRSWKMPLASSRPSGPGQPRTARPRGRSARPAIRLARTRWNCCGSSSGRLPWRAVMTFAKSVELGVCRWSPRPPSDPCRWREPATRPSAPPRSPGSPSRVPTSSTRASPVRSSSDHSSMPTRHSRVVGCRPVPKAHAGIELDDEIVRRGLVLAPASAGSRCGGRGASPGSAPSRPRPSPPRGRGASRARRWAAGRRPGGGPGRGQLIRWRRPRHRRLRQTRTRARWPAVTYRRSPPALRP